MQSTPLSAMAAPTAGAQSSTNKNAILGKDDFLKILVGEMQNMDPMSSNNQDPTQSVAQMAQFSIVEQLTNLAKANEKSSAMAMLGKTATYVGVDGTPASGTVQSVDTSKSDPTLTIGDRSGIAIASVTEVR